MGQRRGPGQGGEGKAKGQGREEGGLPKQPGQGRVGGKNGQLGTGKGGEGKSNFPPLEPKNRGALPGPHGSLPYLPWRKRQRLGRRHHSLPQRSGPTAPPS